VAIIQALFDRLRIARIMVSKSALREGVLYDLLGRIHHEDERDRTVGVFLSRYRVDRAQAARVEATAVRMLEQVAAKWEIADVDGAGHILQWAARLHEVGLSINYDSYHKHSAYLVQHSNMPGFSHADQAMLTFLLNNQRKKLRLETMQILPGDRLPDALKLCVLLRMAICLHRGRRTLAREIPLTISASQERVGLAFPARWLDKHPLTAMDLKEERETLGRAGIALTISDISRNGSQSPVRRVKKAPVRQRS
jgi:exopolyphosphatase/guanosine-5'-triphosphate,3'-diphosphate pyrophosphatase